MQELNQKQRVLQKLKDAKGEWVSGMAFLKPPAITQFHARIFELQREGYEIKGEYIHPDHNWKYYKLISEPKPISPFKKKPEPKFIEKTLKLEL
jgi:hypothetical protein